MRRLLVIDDDMGFCEMMADYLKPEGFEVISIYNGMDALKQVLTAAKDEYDLILLDITLPGMNGFEILQRIRSRQNTPVIMLTGRTQSIDSIVGLEIGADDFLLKPCNPRELLARVRAILRRTTNNLNEEVRPASERITLGDIELDGGSRIVRRNGEELQLTSIEFSFLEILLRTAGYIVTREQLAQSALGRNLGAYDRSVDMHVSHLRKKLGHKYRGIDRIKTIRGVGFVYTIPNPFDTDF
ncbi:MAG: response regulator transcription factor [Syntrophobacteraceae bacterium]